jgi:pimeloyl-ACP methyl ester carboxylesterase
VKAVELKLGHKIVRPTLIGLSAGGFGACRIFAGTADNFSRLVVLAAYPPEETLGKFNSTMSVYFLVGANESYVQSGYFGNSIRSLRNHQAKVIFQALPNADHFFLLSQREETLKILHGWLDEPASK